MTAGGLYLYAVVPGTVDAAALGAGIDGQALRLVPGDGVAAVVHRHDGPPYAGTDEEVRRRVLEHDAVVERLWAPHRPLLPMTFDVIVAGTEAEAPEARVERWLTGTRSAIEERLHAVEGRVELRADVTLAAGPAAKDDPDVLRVDEEMRAASPGVQRLLRKRLQRLEQQVAERLAARLYPEVRARLAARSADLVEHDRATPAAGEVLVLSAALLVAEDSTQEIGEALAAIAAEQPAVRIRFLGPWPPYSFAALRPGAEPMP